MVIVSVVIPVYNAEQYIEQTLDSLVCQTFSDWECIMVDDCSSDATMPILERYAAKDVRFRIFSTPKNSGSPKIPIDQGVDESEGEFICIVGCDDYLDPDSIEIMLNRQKQTSADMVCLRMVGFDNVSGLELFSIPKSNFDFSQVLSGKQAVMLTIGRWRLGANAALIKREIVTSRKSYHSTEIVQMNADEYDTRDMLIRSDKVAFADTNYHYRRHTASITRKISHKLFEVLITDRMLIELLSDCFGSDSKEALKMKHSAVSSLRHAYRNYDKIGESLSEESRTVAERIINDQYSYLVKLSRKGLSLKNRLFLYTSRKSNWHVR